MRSMTIHKDPTLYTEYSRIAEQADNLRLYAAQIAERLPEEYKVGAGMLSYHLRKAFYEASKLAGEPPQKGAE